MTIQEFKRIARLLKQVYAELEKECIEAGISLLSPEYTDLMDKARLKVLEQAGYTLEEYRSIKEQVEGIDKAGTLATLQETQKKLEEIDNRYIPTEADIKLIAHEVAKQYIVPPVVTNQIIKETTIEKPRIVETVKKITYKEEYDDSGLRDMIRQVEEKIPKIEKYDDTELRELIVNHFSENFAKNIDMLGMPNFRQLATGLRQDLDTKIEGVNTHKLTVSATSPSNPQLNDLWLDIS